MAANVRVVLEPPPWVPDPYLNSGTMKAALNAAADAVIADIASDGQWEWASTAEGEATVMIAFRGVDFDAVAAEFDGTPEQRHAMARKLGI